MSRLKLEDVWRYRLSVPETRYRPRKKPPLRPRSRFAILRSILRSPWFWLAGLVVTASIIEVRTSAVQSLAFSTYASTISFDVDSGPSDSITFPRGGPFDRNRGYPEIPTFVSRLKPLGFTIARQARDSAGLIRLISWGIYPPYDQPAVTGLRIRASDGSVLRDITGYRSVFESFDQIPTVIVRSVVFIENRELEADSSARQNPAVEWDRLGRAGLFYVGRMVGLPLRSEGGSTLAVQLEKYRHSPGGQTG